MAGAHVRHQRVSAPVAFLLGIPVAPVALLITSALADALRIDPEISRIFIGGFVGLAGLGLSAAVGCSAGTWAGAAAAFAGTLLALAAAEAWVVSPGLPGLSWVGALAPFAVFGILLGHGLRELVRTIRADRDRRAQPAPTSGEVEPDAAATAPAPSPLRIAAGLAPAVAAASTAGFLTAGAAMEAGQASFLLDADPLGGLLLFAGLGAWLGVARTGPAVLLASLAGVVVGEAVSLQVAATLAAGDATRTLVGTVGQVRLGLTVGAALPIVTTAVAYAAGHLVATRSDSFEPRLPVRPRVVLRAAAVVLVAVVSAAALGYASASAPLVAVRAPAETIRVVVDGEAISTDRERVRSPVVVALEIREMPFGGYYWVSLLGPLTPAEVAMVHGPDFTPADLREKWQEFDYGPGQRTLGTLTLEPGTYVWYRHPMDGFIGEDPAPYIVPLAVD